MLDDWLFDSVGLEWLSIDPLGDDPGVGLLGLNLGLVVDSDTVQEVLPGSGFLHVLDADVNALGDDAVAHLLIDDDSDGAGIDVEDSAGLAVVVLVGHALVDGSIDSDIDDLSSPVGSQGLGDADSAFLSEALLELVTGASTIAV